MRTFSVVHPRLWTMLSKTGIEIRRQGLEVTATALYLVTCPHSNALGLYYLPLAAMNEELGVPAEKTRQLLDAVCATGFAEYFEAESLIWVPQMARYQIGETMKPGDHRRRWALRELAKLEGTEPHAKFLERYGEAYHLLPKPKPPIRLVDRKQRGQSGGGAQKRQNRADRMTEARKLERLLETSGDD